MAYIKTHCEDCEMLLGQPYENVHRWLDEYTKEYPVDKYLEYHRRFRHNKKGVEEVKKMWGIEAEMAAKIHLARDAEWPPLPKSLHKMKEAEVTEFVEACYRYFPKE